MKALLIVNGFLNTQKFEELYEMFQKSAKKFSVVLDLKTNDEIMIDINSENVYENKAINDVDFILFWDKDVKLARYLENLGFKVFNSAKSIAICDDKSLTHLYLMNSGIKMPRTIVAPMTYANIGYTNYDYLEKVKKALAFPIIVKEVFGSFGRQVYMASNATDLETIVKKHSDKSSLIFQEYISRSKGRDIRLQVVKDKVVASMYRYNDSGDFRANLSNGGKMKNYSPTKEEADIAIKSCKILGLDFAGVDLLFGEEDQPIVCEVNSNAHFKNITEVSGISISDYIIEHIINQVKENN